MKVNLGTIVLIFVGAYVARGVWNVAYSERSDASLTGKAKATFFEKLQAFLVSPKLNYDGK